jgi:hypothetical protein
VRHVNQWLVRPPITPHPQHNHQQADNAAPHRPRDSQLAESHRTRGSLRRVGVRPARQREERAGGVLIGSSEAFFCKTTIAAWLRSSRSVVAPFILIPSVLSNGCERCRARTDNFAAVDVCVGRLGTSATPGRIESPSNSSTRDTRQQSTDIQDREAREGVSRHKTVSRCP